MSRVETGEFIQAPVMQKVCDLCGKPMGYEQGLDDSLMMNFSFGFHTKRDGQAWAWDVCNNCAEPLIAHIESLRKYRGLDGSDPDEFCCAD